jgi:hypothetical protein
MLLSTVSGISPVPDSLTGPGYAAPTGNKSYRQTRKPVAQCLPLQLVNFCSTKGIFVAEKEKQFNDCPSSETGNGH